MWYTKDIILPLGYIELLTGSPPFYLSRFSLRAIFLIHEHHILFTSNLGYKISKFKPYSTADYHTIKDLTAAQENTFTQSLQFLETEDVEILHETVANYNSLAKTYPTIFPTQDLRGFVQAVISEWGKATKRIRIITPSARMLPYINIKDATYLLSFYR